MQIRNWKTKRTLSWLSLFVFIITLSIIVVSCNKKFDEPPSYVGPNITPDLAISDLKAMHTNGGLELITEDKTIGGVVVADDLSGNFYKTIVIQDETGGIQIKLDGFDLYTQYPVGRMVYIKVKGLYLGDYNKLLQLGGGIDNTVSPARLGYLASTLFDQYIIKGSLNNVITPKVVKVADLNDSYQNTLIQLDNFEFATGDTSKQFADVTLTASAINYTIKSCGGESIILRNSSYADFAGYDLPNGNGSILAIYTVFGSTKQLNIRDSSDVKFYNTRCGGGGGGGGGTGSIISISDLRALYTGTEVSLGSYQVKGIVISDAGSKNISAGNIILQDGAKGIALYFGSSAATSNFLIGDSLVVDITGGTLKQFSGSLEVVLPSSSLPNTKAGTGKTVTPQTLTVSQFNSAMPDIEYTLVKFVDATASGNATYSGNNTLTDASGSTTMYTKTGSSGATFGGDALPTTAKTWVGYGSMFNSTKQFSIRNTADVTDGGSNGGGGGGGGGTGTADLIFSEYIEGSSNNKYIEIYNAGSAAADLSRYIVKLYANGTTTATNSAKLDTLVGSSTLAPGAILVLKQPSAVLALPGGVTAFSSSVCNFNGDDALTIEKDGTVIDVFGTVGTDPGTSWTVAGSTSGAADKTVRRKSTVTAGNTDWASSSANEWDLASTDDVSNLGSR
ncbi:DUF5689 domain-containing protein [Limnovirga soli]|uniref:LTD domain-containing protein n=1 Tax=Limnovirga soli TaxID=2656915 RepID=A0A8J8JR90_9BACT|nr:DUF5689 domain-containing protein [Limnovirga soli]NNV55607.1 hypothetical protein [Limnovirga soli]